MPGSTRTIAAPIAPTRRFASYVRGGVTPVCSFQTDPIDPTNFSLVRALPERFSPSSSRSDPV